MSAHADQSTAKNSQRLVGALVVGSVMQALYANILLPDRLLQPIAIAMQ
jgi:hypothetical protein